jgi:hypothetical protein
VTESPEWWKQSKYGAELMDEEVLVQLYNKVMEQEDLWKKELKESQKGNAPKGS